MEKEIGIEIQERLSLANRYNGWIYQNIRPFLGQRILDAGCSVGNTTQFFLDKELVIGLDVSAQAISIIETRFKNHPNFTAVNLDLTSPKVSRLKKEKINTVVCLNTLEHVKEDELALAKIHQILVPQGRLILLVPAFRWLFGTMDQADHHFRRYEKPELNQKLKTAGFKIRKQFFMNFLGIFGWLVNGRILKRRLIPESNYVWYDRLVPILARVEAFFPPPLGLSLITVAQKP